MEMDFAGEGWSKAHTYGKLRSSHWGRPLEFSFSRSSTGSHDFARAALVQVDPLMKALGRPVRENLSTSRDNDATLLQALTLTNGDLIHQRLHEAAEQWLHDDGNDPEQLVHRLYTQLLLRSPSRSERRYLTRSWQEVVEADELADAIWSMTMSPEFQFL